MVLNFGTNLEPPSVSEAGGFLRGGAALFLQVDFLEDVLVGDEVERLALGEDALHARRGRILGRDAHAFLARTVLPSGVQLEKVRIEYSLLLTSLIPFRKMLRCSTS